jgi:hypothetical protein
MANKTIVESVKLAVSAGGSFLITRAVSKSDAVTKVMQKEYPGLSSAAVASGIFAGSVKMGRQIKDTSIRTGIQAGTGAAAMVQIANIAQVKKNLPKSLQDLLAGDPNPNVVLFKPEQLQAAIQAEAERHANTELAKMGYRQIESNPMNSNQNRDTYIEQPETVNGEDIDSLLFGDNEIYSDFNMR